MPHNKKPRAVYRSRTRLTDGFPHRIKLYEITFEGIKTRFNTIDKCIVRGQKLEGRIKRTLSEIRIEQSEIDFIRVELNVLNQVIEKSKKVAPIDFSVSGKHKKSVYITSFEGIENAFDTLGKRIFRQTTLNAQINWSLREIKDLERSINLDREHLNIVNSVIRSFRKSKVLKLNELSKSFQDWFHTLDETLLRRQRLEHDLKSDVAKIAELQQRVELIQEELKDLDQSVIDKQM